MLNKVWCTQSLRRIYSIYSTYDVGDVFSVVYSTKLETVYLGAQNTSIQVSAAEKLRVGPTTYSVVVRYFTERSPSNTGSVEASFCAKSSLF